MNINKIPTIVVLILLIGAIVGLDTGRRYLSGDFKTGTERLEVLYSSEKAGWLESVVEGFEEEWQENTSQNIDVVMTPIGTGKGTIQVANKASQPTIWSPASRFWLPILNVLWQENNRENIVDVNAPALVVSPIVIATWKFYQEDKNIGGLQDLHDLAANDPDFTFAHTDPYSSNSGFGSVIMEAAVAADKVPEDLTIADLSDPDVQEWMRTLESAAVQYGSSTGFLGKLMANEGPSQLKAALLYENLIVEKNRELKNKIEQGLIPENQVLVAVYPEEGTILNDHPFTILNAPWVDNRDREIGQLFINYLLREDIQDQAVEYGFRPVVDVDPSLIESVFTEDNGVSTNISDIPTYSINNLDGRVLNRIPDLWSATRSRSLDGNVDANRLVPSDYIMPVIIGTIFLIMILNPVYKRIRRYLA